jgi:hypothetical protein
MIATAVTVAVTRTDVLVRSVIIAAPTAVITSAKIDPNHSIGMHLFF